MITILEEWATILLVFTDDLPKPWIYDTARNETMTKFFFGYAEFQTPILVNSIDHSTLLALKNDTIYRQPLSDLNNKVQCFEMIESLSPAPNQTSSNR